MVKINLPTTFMNVEDLAERWQCSVHKIQALAEEKKIQLFVRPIALEIALETYAGHLLPGDVFMQLANRPLDCKDIYRLFNNKAGKIQICNKLGNTTLCIEAQFSDIVIPVDVVESFECSYGDRPVEDLIKILQSDFSYIVLRGREHTFGATQAKVIKRLYLAYMEGNPWQYGKHLLADVGSASERIHNLFRSKSDWQDVILSDHKGRFRLNLPPQKHPQMTLF